ncbi:hypothetical protein GW932_04785 [archaeon]|nr:hypothetical protein [archaeon]
MRKGHQSEKKKRIVKVHESKYLGKQEIEEYKLLTIEIANTEIMYQSESFCDKYFRIKDSPTRENYNQLKAMYKVAIEQVDSEEKGKHLDNCFSNA